MFNYPDLPSSLGGVEFKGWGKTPRNKGNTVTITEKIDGTNACVIVRDGEVIGAQSRNKLINIGEDNMGFAAFVWENREALATLGDGYHYGEWAGPGIQKNPHMLLEKTFFLFNTFRPQETLPDCVKQVPVLYRGPLHASTIDDVMEELRQNAHDSAYIPEGVIIYSHDTRTYMKDTFLNRRGKWAAQ
jgi:hypothetical protein